MTITEQIQEILIHFDWETVHKAMAALDWRWDGGIPEPWEMRQVAVDLMEKAAEPLEQGFSFSAGGFRACYNDVMTLSFEVAEYESSESDEV